MRRPRNPDADDQHGQRVGEGADNGNLLDLAPQSERERAFTALFRATYPELCAYVARSGGEEIVQDVIAESFLVTWRRWDDVPEDPSARRGWLYGVVKRTVQHEIEARIRASRLSRRIAPFAADRMEGGDAGQQIQSNDSVRMLLAHLPPSERDAVLLTVFGDLSPSEAADVIGCSVTALSTRLSRARIRLRAVLAAERGTPDGDEPPS